MLNQETPREELILTLWERGRKGSSTQRSLVLLAAARAELDDTACLALSIGDRDSALLRLRIALFGQLARAYLQCPACEEGLEFERHLPDLLLTSPSEEDEPRVLSTQDWTIHFRLPTSADLVALSSDPGARTGSAEARQALVSRIVTSATRRGDRVVSTQLPDSVIAALEERLAQCDPQADIRFGQRCPTCGHEFEATFDVSSYLWREVDVHARRLLSEVDLLARSYGWTEATVLGLSPARREIYLDLCKGL